MIQEQTILAIDCNYLDINLWSCPFVRSKRTNPANSTKHTPCPSLSRFTDAQKISRCNSGTFVKGDEVKLWFYSLQPVLAPFELSIPTYAYIY